VDTHTCCLLGVTTTNRSLSIIGTILLFCGHQSNVSVSLSHQTRDVSGFKEKNKHSSIIRVFPCRVSDCQTRLETKQNHEMPHFLLLELWETVSYSY